MTSSRSSCRAPLSKCRHGIRLLHCHLSATVQGTEYEVGDFTLRIGSVLLNNVSKNTIVLEVRYLATLLRLHLISRLSIVRASRLMAVSR